MVLSKIIYVCDVFHVRFGRTFVSGQRTETPKNLKKQNRKNLKTKKTKNLKTF